MFLIPIPSRILRTVEETKNVKTLFLENRLVSEKARPGNFLLVWVPFPANGVIDQNYDLDQLDQLPMSISFADPQKGIVGITVENVGPTTSEMHKHVENSLFGVIGPRGNSFTIEGDRCILVSGGTGVAPLQYLTNTLAKKGKKIIGIVGFKTKTEMFFIDKMREVCGELTVVTEDGSYGKRGMVTEFLPRIMEQQRKQSLIDRSEVVVYCCGPELMMKKVLELCKNFHFSSQFSLERYIHCGIGMCGFCAFDGLRVCKDGPVFSGRQLEKIEDFGTLRRRASGRKEPIGP